MTPQLQQAIRLLQLSTVELEAEVQEALESNPMLEQDEGAHPETTEPDSADNSTDREATPTAEGSSENIPDELPTDSNWDDVFDTGATSFSTPESGSGRDILDTATVTGAGLHDHLIWQLELTNFSETDRQIAHMIIDSIDDDGYLQTSTAELLATLDSSMEIELDEVQAVLHRIQQFDPIGVAARDLQESLQLQLSQFDADAPWLREARILVRDYFNLLSNRDFNRLCRKMKLTTEELQQVIQLIQSLNPRPGSSFNTAETEYIVPDVYVVRKNGKWQVELNTDSMPKLRINTMYANMVKRGSNSKDNNYLRGNLQEARWFLKSLQSRHETLLKVASCIVEQHASRIFSNTARKP